MTDHDLYDLLERAANAVPVGEPPIAEMIDAVARRRRVRNWGLVVVSSVVAAAVAVVVALVAPVQMSQPDVPPPPASSPQPTPPSGTRLVGIGHVAVAIPDDWATNKVFCGTPLKDTVIIDQNGSLSCLEPWRPGVDAVELEHVRDVDFDGEPIEISGVVAEVYMTCDDQSLGPSPSCGAVVYVPSEEVRVTVSSDSESVVKRVLQHIYVLPNLVAVPGFWTMNDQEGVRAGVRYVDLLGRLGLRPDDGYVSDTGLPEGYVVNVKPEVGTMLPAGAEVQVTVAG